MLGRSMNALEKLLQEKQWNTSDLAREYGKLESPELSAEELIKKYGSMIRKAVKDPEHTKHGTVKKLVEILGGEMVVRVKRVEDMPI